MAEHDEYPVDEFDDLTPASKKGAHRKPSGPLSQGAAIALVTVLAIVALVLVAGTVNIIQRSSTNPEKQDDAAQVQESDVAGGTPTPKAKKSSKAVDAAPVKRGDFDVHVLNASNKTGAAASLKDKLEGKGWNVTDTANESDSSKTTTVFYSQKDNKAAAAKLAQDIGGKPTDIKQSDRYDVDLAVLLCSDLA